MNKPFPIGILVSLREEYSFENILIRFGNKKYKVFVHNNESRFIIDDKGVKFDLALMNESAFKCSSYISEDDYEDCI